MAHEVAWAESAIAGLVEVVEYISRDSPSYAAGIALQAERAAASLAELPDRGRRVPEFRDLSVRELSVSRYRLIYRVQPKKVVILAFVHKARDLGAIGDD